MSETFVLLERAGNGYLLKDTDRGDTPIRHMRYREMLPCSGEVIIYPSLFAADGYLGITGVKFEVLDMGVWIPAPNVTLRYFNVEVETNGDYSIHIFYADGQETFRVVVDTIFVDNSMCGKTDHL